MENAFSFLSEGVLKTVQILPSHGHHSYEMGSALLLILGDNFSSGRKPAGEGASLLDPPLEEPSTGCLWLLPLILQKRGRTTHYLELDIYERILLSET